eukprot:CAMPEP_0204525598 /NCGR_PEP_ID=MMETSP0661-20131031/7991_1 /ASSEMBLY_ACC=CAM_ASM_000606 /TAXON_ID=109239 /ORGANISM="Alexandrium margalefi, Strain AMGDE01CS-322" /LENGTH=108 /DNA_ID=CAMNT_0051531399 /DNA_START=33 /DNA_END=357 /DNA_ORIENTATION=+
MALSSKSSAISHSCRLFLPAFMEASLSGILCMGFGFNLFFRSDSAFFLASLSACSTWEAALALSFASAAAFAAAASRAAAGRGSRQASSYFFLNVSNLRLRRRRPAPF